MKEYLNKETHEFVRSHSELNDMWIEIPEGAIRARFYPADPDSGIEFENQFAQWWHTDKLEWIDYMDQASSNEHSRIVWRCHTQPEELPFVDDASLNDQYAEIEKVRQNSKLDQSISDFKNTDHGKEFDEFDLMADTLFADAESSKHNHYYIDVSNVDEVDFYEIALRYNVTDPCIQHILKKCLAVGGRGHKDFHTDLKDIYDTAKRALDIHKVDQ